MSITASIKSINDPSWTLKQLTEANRKGLGAAGRHWHSKMMPRHFTVEGGKKYGYQKRKGDDEPPRVPITRDGKTTYRTNQHYSWIKRRRKGHNKPLVFTGQAEESAKRSVEIRINKVKGEQLLRCKVVMSLPRYFYAYRKDLSQPDKYAELIRTTPDEETELTNVHNEASSSALSLMPQKETKRVI